MVIMVTKSLKKSKKENNLSYSKKTNTKILRSKRSRYIYQDELGKTCFQHGMI